MHPFKGEKKNGRRTLYETNITWFGSNISIERQRKNVAKSLKQLASNWQIFFAVVFRNPIGRSRKKNPLQQKKMDPHEWIGFFFVR